MFSGFDFYSLIFDYLPLFSLLLGLFILVCIAFPWTIMDRQSKITHCAWVYGIILVSLNPYLYGLNDLFYWDESFANGPMIAGMIGFALAILSALLLARTIDKTATS